MSKKHRHRHSHADGQSAETTVLPPTQQQEKTMEATSQEVTEPTQEKPEAPQGLTAKQMAAMEELNQARILKQLELQNAPPPPPAPNITDVISQGFDALNEAWKNASKQAETKEYVPPPRTARQMTALEEELEAGRKAVERAQAQQEEAARQRAVHAAAEAAKEGFTTPVYRPGDAVPDPITGKLGTFGSNT